MENLEIAGHTLTVKDYFCACGTETYDPNPAPKLWLYINTTDQCPANCLFCINPCRVKNSSCLSIEKLESVINSNLSIISGVSITGGEPLANPSLFRELLRMLRHTLPSEIELDLVTNGCNLDAIANTPDAEILTSIHISRHAVCDEQNNRLMNWKAPSISDLSDFMGRTPDPDAVTFNCVLQKSGVHTADGIAEYLEMAASLKVRNTSFVGMFPANDYCREEFVSPESLNLMNDCRFRIWGHFHDYQYCQCCNGDYLSLNGPTRFYYRWPGKECSEYTRQLVYTADNHLQAGFGGIQLL